LLESRRVGPLRLLAVEDEPTGLDALEAHLGTQVSLRRVARPLEALRWLEQEPADLVLVDVHVPPVDGRTFLEAVRLRVPGARVVLLTAFGAIRDAVTAMHGGAYGYLTRPLQPGAAAALVRNAARELALSRQAAALRRAVRGPWSAEALVGSSPEMEEVRRVIRQAAGLPATVLLTGRAGSGKELAARAIHHEGPRAAGPLVVVRCNRIPEGLFESAMLGRRGGAAPGPVPERAGWAERASGGTLFLDQVTATPLAQQATLVRLLQDYEVTLVGSARAVRVDLRVVAATDQDVESLVRRRLFREDLLHRLDVVRLHLPELDERPGDLPALAHHLVRELADGHGLPAPAITGPALAALSSRRWPGNVGELRSVLERAVLAARDRPIDAADVPASCGPPAAPAAGGPEPAAPLKLREVERDHLLAVLRHCEGNRTRAARVLGIDRRTLFAKLRRHGLAAPGEARGGEPAP
jgi:two-component system response regulator AtoC